MSNILCALLYSLGEGDFEDMKVHVLGNAWKNIEMFRFGIINPGDEYLRNSFVMFSLAVISFCLYS